MEKVNVKTIEREVTKYNLPQIMFDLHRNKKTGTLTVSALGITRRVYFNKGNAIFASSTSEDERLGETLIKLGKITYKQYEESVELLKKTGKKQGAILVELGYLTPKDMILGVQYQIREMITRLFLLENAEYDFKEGKLPSHEVITLQISMRKLIYEALKRNNNLSMIRREMPDVQAILHRIENPPDILNDIVLSPQDEEILSLVDGTKTMTELIKSSSSNSFEAMRTLYVLNTIGFVEERKEAVNRPEESNVAVEEVEPYPEDGALEDESPPKPFEFANSVIREENSPAGDRTVKSEAKQWWSVDTTEQEITSEPMPTTEPSEPATAGSQTETSSGVTLEPVEKKDVEALRDRRRHKRFKVEGAEVNGEMLFTKEVNVLDMSISGIALQTDRQLKIGKEYLLNLQDEEKIISIKAVVVRSTLSQSRTDSSGDVIPLYFVGMEFCNLSDEKIDEISKFIDNHKAGDQPKQKTNGKTEQRKSTRFEMNIDGKTVLNFQELYKVKVISLNGMLIDSSHFLDLEDKLRMKIILPRDEEIDFVGRVASCSEKGEDELKRYDIGIEFIEMAEEHKEKLKEFFKNIEDIRRYDISAVQTEAPEKKEISGTHILNTGDADLYILQGKYTDAMAIYHELLSKDPSNIQVLERIEALSTLLLNLNQDEPPIKALSPLAPQTTTEVRKRQTSRIDSTDSSVLSAKSKKNALPSRWYGKFIRRIIPSSSANSPK